MIDTSVLIKEDQFMIDHHALSEDSFSLNEKYLLWYLNRRSFETIDQMEIKTGINKEKLREILKNLKHKQVVFVEYYRNDRIDDEIWYRSGLCIPFT